MEVTFFLGKKTVFEEQDRLRPYRIERIGYRSQTKKGLEGI